jgi:hypothetical protein
LKVFYKSGVRPNTQRLASDADSMSALGQKQTKRHVRFTPESRHLSAFETFAAFARAQVSPGTGYTLLPWGPSDTPVAACCGVDSQLVFPVDRPQCN